MIEKLHGQDCGYSDNLLFKIIISVYVMLGKIYNFLCKAVFSFLVILCKWRNVNPKNMYIERKISSFATYKIKQKKKSEN